MSIILIANVAMTLTRFVVQGSVGGVSPGRKCAFVHGGGGGGGGGGGAPRGRMLVCNML